MPDDFTDAPPSPVRPDESTLFDLPEDLSPERQWLALCSTRGVEIAKESDTGRFIAEIWNGQESRTMCGSLQDSEASAVEDLHAVITGGGLKPPFPTFDAWRLDQRLKREGGRA